MVKNIIAKLLDLVILVLNSALEIETQFHSSLNQPDQNKSNLTNQS